MFCGESERGLADGPAVTVSVACVLACLLTSRMSLIIQTFPAGAVPVTVAFVTVPIIICFSNTAMFPPVLLGLSFLHQSQHQRVLRVGLKLVIFFVARRFVNSLDQSALWRFDV